MATSFTRSDSLNPAIAHTSMAPDMMACASNGEQEGQMQMLQTFYQAPPYQNNSQSAFDFNLNGANSMGAGSQNLPPNSIYSSDIPTLATFIPSGSERSTIANSVDLSSQSQQFTQFGGFGLDESLSFPSMAGPSTMGPSTMGNQSSLMNPTSALEMNESAMFLPNDHQDLNTYQKQPGFDWEPSFY
jgi:hypothetical protein